MINLIPFGVGFVITGFAQYIYHMFQCFSAIDRNDKNEIDHRKFMMKFNMWIVLIGLLAMFIGVIKS